MKADKLAKWEHKIRPLTTKLPPKTAVSLYSQGRLDFLEKLKEETPKTRPIPKELERTLWGLTFRSPLMNAAGMFKNGECYDLVAAQGAGGYLAGTVTANPRKGNDKEGIHLPFTPYPQSHAASNWLGLPNDGEESVLDKIVRSTLTKKCPVGLSIMGSPDLDGSQKLEALLRGMERAYRTSIDFLEINESCPNTSPGTPQEDALFERLHYLSENLLRHRRRNFPVIVKFSNDTLPEHVPDLVNTLLTLGYDGVNFGNTSTNYDKRKAMIAKKEHNLYNYFTKTFGGGVSGRPLKQDSLLLASIAAKHIKQKPTSREFHAIRTGGIETAEDLQQSEKAGIPLNQWFTGYFERFARDGHDVYAKLYQTPALKQKISPKP